MPTDHERVLRAIEDRFYEENQLSDKTDIREATELSRNRLNSVIEELTGTGIVPVYHKESVSTVYATQQMVNSLAGAAGEPEWIEDYEFEQKRELRDSVRESNERIADFQKLERLLFGSGDPLEESTKYALEQIGFEVDSTESEEDLLVEYHDNVYVMEVKGVGEIIHKKHITQLAGWLDMKISEGVPSDNLIGLLVHNTERYDPPEERGDPLTDTAKEFLRHRQSRHVSTHKLFNLVKSFRNEDITESEAQEDFLEGEQYA